MTLDEALAAYMLQFGMPSYNGGEEWAAERKLLLFLVQESQELRDRMPDGLLGDFSVAHNAWRVLQLHAELRRCAYDA